MVVESILDAGLGAPLEGRSGGRAFVMYHNGRGHILHVSVSTEEAGRRLGYRGGSGLFTKSRRVNIPSFLI